MRPDTITAEEQDAYKADSEADENDETQVIPHTPFTVLRGQLDSSSRL